MMDSARGYKPMNKMKIKRLENAGFGFNPNTVVIIKLPILRIISQSLFLAVVVLTLPSIGRIITGSSADIYESTVGLNLIDFELLPTLFEDLKDEGVLKEGHKGLILSSAIEESVEVLEFLSDKDVDFVMDSDLETQSSIPNEMFDVVFTLSSRVNEFVDRVLKKNGIVVFQLGYGPLIEFQNPLNYKIVYLRQFNSPVLALKKIGSVYNSANSPIKRSLCGFDSSAKKAIISSLVQPSIESPIVKSSDLLRKIKFSPDPIEFQDTRILIIDDDDDDDENGELEWFYENYPMKGKKFEVYQMGDVEIGLSNGLVKNVKKEDYMVVKAGAELEEMVEELFLECKKQRAYWQCLALYGKLRDAGVDVRHQW